MEPLAGAGFRVEQVMGMPIGIDLRDWTARRDRSQTEAVLDRCFAVLRAADDVFSLWRPETPMARLVAGTATWAELPSEVPEVLRRCARAARETDDAFRARDRAGRVDPTGLVKGWAVARVGRLLLSAGLQHWCITAAGDVLAHGEARAGQPWAIGIADPDRPGDLVDAVQLTDGAIATSGPAERGAHIWDGRTGAVAQGVASATVVCADIIEADVLATAAVVWGRSAIARLDTRPGVEGLVVHVGGEVETTRGWSALRGASGTTPDPAGPV